MYIRLQNFDPDGDTRVLRDGEIGDAVEFNDDGQARTTKDVGEAYVAKYDRIVPVENDEDDE